MRQVHVIAQAARRRSQAPRRFLHARDGVTTVEFALVAPVFFLLLFSIIEIALISFSKSSLQTGMAHAARLVRTGNAQCLSDDAFIDALCSRASMAPNCTTKTTIERKVFPIGSGGAGLAVDVDEFKALTGGDIVMIRASYAWTVQSPLVEPFFNDGAGDFPLRSTLLFKNEQFASKSCS